MELYDDTELCALRLAGVQLVHEGREIREAIWDARNVDRSACSLDFGYHVWMIID
jgi:hypothetical protein